VQQQTKNILAEIESWKLKRSQMKEGSAPEFTARINLVTTPRQREAIRAAAQRNLVSSSDWIRRAVQIQLARDELKTRQPDASR
jgi:hypothetical protein